MPKIDAPTVAEHHRRRRADLVSAATELLATQGADAVTLGAVGTATGLARSSVYQYFGSAHALVAAVVEDIFPRATERLDAAVAGANTPADELDEYVRTALHMATEPAHRAVYALERGTLPETCRTRIIELHAEQFAPLRAAIADLGVGDPELTTALVRGLIGAAVRAVSEGAPIRRVQRRTLSLIHDGL